MSDPVQPIHSPFMEAMARLLDDELNSGPAHYGFTLLVFDFGDHGKMNYISNAQREDMISALKECAAILEGRKVDYESRDQ